MKFDDSIELNDAWAAVPIDLQKRAALARIRHLQNPTPDNKVAAESLWNEIKAIQRVATWQGALKQHTRYFPNVSIEIIRATQLACETYLKTPTESHLIHAEYLWQQVTLIRENPHSAEDDRRNRNWLNSAVMKIVAVDQQWGKRLLYNPLIQELNAGTAYVILGFVLAVIAGTVSEVWDFFSQQIFDTQFVQLPSGAYPAFFIAFASILLLLVVTLGVRASVESPDLDQIKPLARLLYLGIFLFEVGRAIRITLATTSGQMNIDIGIETHRATLAVLLFLAVLLIRIYELSNNYRVYLLSGIFPVLISAITLSIIFVPDSILSSDSTNASILASLNTFFYLEPVSMISAGDGWGHLFYQGTLALFFLYLLLLASVNVWKYPKRFTFIQLLVTLILITGIINDVLAFRGDSNWLLLDYSFLVVIFYLTILQIRLSYGMKSNSQ